MLHSLLITGIATVLTCFIILDWKEFRRTNWRIDEAEHELKQLKRKLKRESKFRSRWL